MASTSSTVYAVTPIVGADLDAKASTPAFGQYSVCYANDGKQHVYMKALRALASTSNFTIGTSGSATTAASSGVLNSYNCNTTGGVAISQYFWARRNAF